MKAATDAQASPKELGFSGTAIAGNYSAKPKMTVSDQWKHFTTRGHQGPVLSCDSTSNSQFIVTGGVDWSIRLWKYDMTHRAHDLIAIVNIPPPSEFPAPLAAGCCFQTSAPAWNEEGRQGVTAVATLHSVRATSDAHKSGPILGGTAYGSLYMFDFSKITPMRAGEEPSSEGIAQKVRLHQAPINDIGALVPTKDGELGGPEVIVITGGDDGKACLLKIRTTEVPNPFRVVKKDETPYHGFLLDLLFFGMGFRQAWEQGQPEAKAADVETGAAKSHKKKTHVTEDGGLIYEEPESCLELVDIGEPTVLEHDGEKVFRVAALGDNEGRHKIAFATCTRDGALLWSKTGQHVMTLRIAGTTKMFSTDEGEWKRGHVDVKVDSHGTMARRKSEKLIKDENGNPAVMTQAVLFLTGLTQHLDHSDSHVGVWAFQDGYLGVQDKRGDLTFSESELEQALAKRKDKNSKDGSAIEPLCIYERGEGITLKVDQAGSSVSFACHLQDVVTVQQWELQAVDPALLVIEPENPSSLLLCPGQEGIMNTFEHLSPVTDFIVTENPEGPVLVTGCHDGSVLMWDVEGPDAGQVISNLRSMTAIEILLPPILLLVTAIQMLSFSFGPAVADHHPKKHFVYDVVVLNYKEHIDMDMADVFWPEMKVVLSILGLFLISALIGGPQRMGKLVHMYCNTLFFIERSSEHGPARLGYSVLVGLRDTVYVYMTLCSTVLVVPLMKACSSAVNCRVPEGKGFQTVFLDSTLAWAPHVKCYEGTHLQVSLLLFLIVPAFLVSVVPYAVTLGDATYVPPDCFYDYRVWKAKNAWRLAAARKAADMHRGFLAFRPRRAFVSGVVELIAKILLPVLSSWLTSFPIEQMLSITAVGFMQLVVAILYPQYLERKFSVFVLCTKAFTLGAMGTGVLTVLLAPPPTEDGKSDDAAASSPPALSPIPEYALAAVFVVCLVTGVLQQMFMESSKPKIRIFNADGARNPTNKAPSSKNHQEGTPLLAAE